jgi:hypothetical protein
MAEIFFLGWILLIGALLAPAKKIQEKKASKIVNGWW